jgi:hypothetical protein
MLLFIPESVKSKYNLVLAVIKRYTINKSSIVLSLSDTIKSRYNLVLAVINTIIGISIFVLVLLFVRDTITVKSKKGVTTHTTYSSATQQIKWRTFQDYAPVVTKSLFSGSTGQLKELSGASDKGTVANDLTLIGTVAGSVSSEFAIFTDKNNKQEVYRTGDKISGLGSLVRIEKDKVSVSDQGRITVIPLADIVRLTEERSPQPSAPAVVDQNKIQQEIDNKFIESPSRAIRDKSVPRQRRRVRRSVEVDE